MHNNVMIIKKNKGGNKMDCGGHRDSDNCWFLMMGKAQRMLRRRMRHHRPSDMKYAQLEPSPNDIKNLAVHQTGWNVKCIGKGCIHHG